MKKFLLVGNPNTGKTTLFNSLTKSNEHVGNWHGVTVSEKEKIKLENKELVIKDITSNKCQEETTKKISKNKKKLKRKIFKAFFIF